jgi:ferrochelatase
MTGVLLLNLGSPSALTEKAVKSYLAEFLMDPYVVDISWIARWLLVHGLILRTRPKKTLELYKKIWTKRESPLIEFSKEQQQALQAQLGPNFFVELGMRYGKPSIREALINLKTKGVTSILVIPLYPQYSLAATESSIQKVSLEMRSLEMQHLSTRVVRDFFDHPVWIRNYSKFLKKHIDKHPHDHVLFSYHGLPERHVKKTDIQGSHCLKSPNCCLKSCDANRTCYRFQCFETTRGLVRELGLSESRVSVAFQSRLGRTPWIKPYTDLEYDRLAKSGTQRLIVISPSFIADCLETLEEIEIRGREQFKRAGGSELIYIPALNSDPSLVSFLEDLVRSPPPHLQCESEQLAAHKPVHTKEH